MKTFGRIDSLQILRAFAFIGIFISHAGIGNFGFLGAFGVSIFLVLSGFLMTYKNISQEKEPQFSVTAPIKKLSKLYPLHILMLLLCVFYEIICQTIKSSLAISISLHTLLLQIWVPIEGIYATLNGPSWYLCVCLFCYLIFPLIYPMVKKQTSKQSIYGSIFILIFLQGLIALFSKFFLSDYYADFFSMKYAVYFFPPSRLLDFVIGMELGKLYTMTDELKIFSKARIYIYIYSVISVFSDYCLCVLQSCFIYFRQRIYKIYSPIYYSFKHDRIFGGLLKERSFFYYRQIFHLDRRYEPICLFNPWRGNQICEFSHSS